MATVLERATSDQSRTVPVADLSGFLAELGESSRRYGLGIGDGASLYLMEQEDYSRSYQASDESDLSFG